LVTIFLTTF
jgi:DnaJ-class molecular chaperone